MRPTVGTRIAITLGDPRGIGPEVAAAAILALADEPDPPDLVLIGPTGTDAERTGAQLIETGDWQAARSEARAGELAGLAVEQAARLALEGSVDAIVTAPIDKAALHAGGFAYPGHTEMLAALSDAPSVAMMLAAEETAVGGPLRVVLATTHLPLSAVPAALTVPLLRERGKTTAAALRSGWDIDRPRLALCALNPHASDHGLFGDEEARVLTPARDALRAEGIDAAGPFPADTVFLRAIRGEFDAVIVPYHDVGMAAFKTVSFGRGVNVTLGLPFIRTSPDHGTALDIAGRGLADPTSMIEAVRLSARLARRGRRTAPSVR